MAVATLRATLVALLACGAVAGLQSCPNDLPLSCHNTTAVANTCCFIPSGQLLQTQFWDTAPSTGPKHHWTVHGLWPDYCDGTYPANCDSSRQYTDIEGILQSFGADETLDYMKTYWKDQSGNDESFWEHEWGKHGTCISTLDPDCYSGYQSKQEVVAYFKRTVSLFKTLPTYDWLAQAGILPSSNRTYTLSAISDALAARHGAPPTLGCSGNSLDEVWYHFNVKGSLQEGHFVAAKPDGSKSSCPSSGILYKLKN